MYVGFENRVPAPEPLLSFCLPARVVCFTNKKHPYSGYVCGFWKQSTWHWPTLAVRLPSALKRLTAEFGMGSGVSTSLEAPDTLLSKCLYCLEKYSTALQLSEYFEVFFTVNRTLQTLQTWNRPSQNKFCWVRFWSVCVRVMKTKLKLYEFISITRLNTSLCFHLWPINLVIFQEILYEQAHKNCLILGLASRLDAFSGYPTRT